MSIDRKWNRLFYGLAKVSLAAFLAAGCGGGGGSDSADLASSPAGSDTAFTGVFADSPVDGIRYETPTEMGYTDEEGQFRYRENETVRFSLGDAELGEAPAAPYMTPMDLVEGAEDVDDRAVTNMARFLQGLDEDGDPENGIQIPPEAEDALTGRPVDFRTDVAGFDVDAHVQGVFDELNERGVFGNGEARGLRGVEAARQHMREHMPEGWEGRWRPGDDLDDDGTAGVLPKFLDENENGINDYVEATAHYSADTPPEEGRQARMAQAPDGEEVPYPEENESPIYGEDQLPMPDDDELPFPGEDELPVPDDGEFPDPDDKDDDADDADDVDDVDDTDDTDDADDGDDGDDGDDDANDDADEADEADGDADEAMNHGHAFIDENGDGICDRAQDGSNTWHGPGFVDEDGDGICDYWDKGQRRFNRHAGIPFVDENGDEVNDLFQFGTHQGPDHEFVDENGDGICDFAQDGSDTWHGPGFDDDDNDGVSDHWEEGGRGHGNTHRHGHGHGHNHGHGHGHGGRAI
jgi:hypothetical protein